MMRTKLDNFNLNVERGVGVVMVDLEPIQLITGAYFVEAWFLDEADTFDLIPMGGRSDWFAVKGIARSYEETSGVYEPIAKWSHHHNEHVAAYEIQTSDSTTTSAK